METVEISSPACVPALPEQIDAKVVENMLADDRLDSAEARAILMKYLKLRGKIGDWKQGKGIEITSEARKAWEMLPIATRKNIQKELPAYQDGRIGSDTVTGLAKLGLSTDTKNAPEKSCPAEPEKTWSEPPKTEPEQEKLAPPKTPAVTMLAEQTRPKTQENITQNLPSEVPTYVSSLPPGKWEGPGNTYCSRIAAANLQQHFGIDAPEWNAIAVQRQIPKIGYTKANPGAGEIAAVCKSFDQVPSDTPVFDIFTKSNSPYGHRCVGYRHNGKIMILDPYFEPPGTSLRFKDPRRCQPMELEKYQQTNNKAIVKIAAYRLPETARTALAAKEEKQAQG